MIGRAGLAGDWTRQQERLGVFGRGRQIQSPHLLGFAVEPSLGGLDAPDHRRFLDMDEVEIAVVPREHAHVADLAVVIVGDALQQVEQVVGLVGSHGGVAPESPERHDPLPASVLVQVDCSVAGLDVVFYFVNGAEVFGELEGEEVRHKHLHMFIINNFDKFL